MTQNLPSEEQLRNYEPPIMSRVHAGDGKLVAEFATEHRVYVPSEELPDQLVQAFISAEDKTFFEHSGIDLWGMFRGAVLNPLMGKRPDGRFDDHAAGREEHADRRRASIDRKVREAVLAMRIEKQLTKDQILELYMNEIYLGGRSYGVGAAALNYFGKSLSDLTLAECAMLGGLPQAPGRVNPILNPEAAIKRRNYVIGRMLENGYIDKAAADAALAEPLKVVDRLNSDENHGVGLLCRRTPQGDHGARRAEEARRHRQPRGRQQGAARRRPVDPLDARFQPAADRADRLARRSRKL